MTPYIFSPLFCSVVFLVLGLFILLNRPSKKQKTLFSVLCFEAFYWQFVWFNSFFYTNSQYIDYLAKISYVTITFLPFSFYHFIVVYLDLKNERRFIIGFYSLGVLLISLLPTNLFVSGHQAFSWGNFAAPGPLYPLFVVSALTAMTRGLIVLIRAYKRPRSYGKKKSQVMCLLLGLLLYYSCALDFFQIYGATWYPVGVFFFIGAFSIISYGIVRHQLMGIAIIVKRTLVFTGLAASSLLIFSLVTYILNTWISIKTGMGQTTTVVTSLAIVAISSEPLYRLLQSKTDKFLFQKKYEHQRALKEAARGITRITDLDSLTRFLIDFLTKKMKTKNASIYLLSEKSESYVLGLSSRQCRNEASINVENPLVRLLIHCQAPVINKVYAHLAMYSVSSNTPNIDSEELLNPYCAQLAIPSFHKDKLVAIIFVGEKSSDDTYNQIDIDTLEALASDVAIALENARLYGHLQASYDKLKTAQVQLIQSEKLASMGQLAAGIAHEVNNPLSIINGQAKVRLNALKNKSSPMVNFLNEVIKQTNRAAGITHKLLKFSKPQRGELDKVEVRTLLTDTLGLVDQQTSMKKVGVEQHFPKKPVFINAREQQIQEVFVNILLNACQAMPQGGALNIRVGEKDDRVETVIQDTGEGIPQDAVQKIFDPFFITKSGGTGLGLFISYQIVKQHGGELKVNSQPGQGTQFIVSLPQKPA